MSERNIASFMRWAFEVSKQGESVIKCCTCKHFAGNPEKVEHFHVDGKKCWRNYCKKDFSEHLFCLQTKLWHWQPKLVSWRECPHISGIINDEIGFCKLRLGKDEMITYQCLRPENCGVCQNLAGGVAERRWLFSVAVNDQYSMIDFLKDRNRPEGERHCDFMNLPIFL